MQPTQALARGGSDRPDSHVEGPESVDEVGGPVFARGPGPLVGAALAAVAFVVVLAVFLHAGSGSRLAQDVGNVCQLLASLAAGLSFAAAARRGGAEARGWALLAVGAFVWFTGAVLWAYYGITRDHVYPFPSLADVGFLGYLVPVVAGLLAFPRLATAQVSRIRALLDGLLIATAVLFVSGATVLGPVFSAGGELLTRITTIAYPVADFTIVSLVLILALRRPAGARLPWVLLGGGLVVNAVTDSVYVALTSTGQQSIGTPVQVGWVAAFLLMALAPLAPTLRDDGTPRSPFTVVQELLPYAPVLAAAVVIAVRPERVGAGEPLLAVSALLALLALVAQQVLVAVEKVVLSAGLEAAVVQRSQQLNAANERFASLVESSADAIVGKTVDGVVSSWNPAAERLYGYRAQDIVGKSALVLVPPHRRDEEAAILAAGAAGGRHRYETERLRQDGVMVPVVLTVSPILVGGVVQGISVIGHDIIERRRHEHELAAARDQALEGSRAKSDFLATMSHEIRTPMNGVIGLCGLLLDTPLDVVQRRYADGVRGSGEALLGIIDDILDFSKLEADKVELEQVLFDPRQLVDEVGLLVGSAASGKGLELVAYCSPDVPATLLGDPGRLRQILMNLTANAVKFTADGEVVLSARVVPATGPSGELNTAAVRFSVTDTGIGIEDDAKTRLFQPFSQADASTTRRFGGTGLGLAICHRLVQAMGGSIDLDSTPELGSTFSFTLTFPVCPGEAAPVHAPDLLVGARILVVDDNATNRLVLSGQLAAWGMTIRGAGDGDSGMLLLREAAAAGAPYDLAVLDLCMPDMDGLALAGAIAADPALATTRTMILTSAGPLDAELARAAGVRQWASKPVRSSELHDALVHLIAPPSEESGPVPLAPPVAVPAQRASRGRVLVVEDNAVNQLVAQGMLHKLGYSSELATDGRQALSALAGGHFDVVLMDCHMPEMDGYQTTEELRRREGDPGADWPRQVHRRTPVIAMTAGVLVEDQERCRAAGMDEFVGKPIDVAVLERALSRQLANGASADPSPAPAPDEQAPDALAPDTSVTAADEAPSARVLDPARLAVLRRMDPTGKAGLVPGVIQAFRQDAPTRLSEVRAAVEAGGGRRLELAAHQLRGSAGNLGATGVSAVCEELEGIGRSGTAVSILDAPGAELTRRLGAALDHADRALSDVLAVGA